MSKTKIAFCIPHMTIGGVEFVLVRTLEELAKHPDLEIYVLFSSPLTEPVFINWFNRHPQIKTKVVFPLCQQFESLSATMHFFPLKQLRKLIFSIYKNIKRFQLCHGKFMRNIDIIIDYASFAFIKEIKHAHKPKITWVHCSIDCFNQRNFYSRTKYYDKIVCLSDSIIHDLSALYPDIAHKLTRIYNPINIQEIRKKSLQPINHDRKYFCCVSRLDYDKDIPTLIRAFDKFFAAQSAPNVDLIIIGDGPMESKFKQLAKQTRACKNIIFAGRQTNPFVYMRGALAHILSSYGEGLPTVLIEAAATGTLNVSSNCKSGPAEILLNGDGGILFTPGNCDELAKIMSDIYSDRVNAQELINNATQALSRFQSNEIIPQIMKTIKEIK